MALTVSDSAALPLNKPVEFNTVLWNCTASDNGIKLWIFIKTSAIKIINATIPSITFRVTMNQEEFRLFLR
jgi:hypothetical protein